MTLWRLQPPPGKPFPVRPLENTMPNLPPEKGISRTLSYHLTSRPAQTNMFYKKELFRIYCKHYFAGGHVSFNDIYLLYRPFSGAISTCLMEHPSNCVRLVDASRPFWASAICKCKRYPQATSPVEIFCEIFLQMWRLRGNAQDFRLHRFFKNGHQMFDSDVLIVWTIWYYYVYIYISCIYIYRIYIWYIYIYVWKSLKSRYCVFLSSSIFSKSQSLASTTGQGWRFKGFHWRWQQFFFPARSNSTTLSLGTQQTQQTPARFFSLHRAWPGDARKCFGGKKVWKHWKLQWLMRILSDPLFDGLVTLQTTNLYHHLASQKTREGTLGSFDVFSGQYII